MSKKSGLFVVIAGDDGIISQMKYYPNEKTALMAAMNLAKSWYDVVDTFGETAVMPDNIISLVEEGKYRQALDGFNVWCYEVGSDLYINVDPVYVETGVVSEPSLSKY
jgi:hypothetical protein